MRRDVIEVLIEESKRILGVLEYLNEQIEECNEHDEEMCDALKLVVSRLDKTLWDINGVIDSVMFCRLHGVDDEAIIKALEEKYMTDTEEDDESECQPF